MTVQDDIAEKIGPQIQTVHDDDDHFPASGLTRVLTIHNNMFTFVATINSTDKNIKNTGHLRKISGTNIIFDIQFQVPYLLATLVAIGT